MGKNMEKIEQIGQNTRILGLEYFDPDRIFDCGQCFRFDRRPDGAWSGIALGRRLQIRAIPGGIEIADCTPERYRTLWRDYLGLSDDYRAIRAELAGLVEDRGPDGKDRACEDDPLRRAMEAGQGIRILRQPPFETLISFLISQNNNIGRIKKNIAALCRAYGDPLPPLGPSDPLDPPVVPGDYAFPIPERLAAAGADGLRGLGLGYRADYVRDAARAVADGTLNLSAVSGMDTADAARALCEIRGVGPKVAACVLLFGFGRSDAFPMDVWVKRLMAKYYPGDRDGRRFGRYAGIAQQYLFYYERYLADREGALH